MDTCFRTGKRTRAALADTDYARVSTLDQDLSFRLDALAAAGCEKIFKDRASGPWRIARTCKLHSTTCGTARCSSFESWTGSGARSPLIDTVTILSKRGVGSRLLTEAIDTTDHAGQAAHLSAT